MPALLELQEAMFAAVAGGENESARPFVLDDGRDAAARLSVYRGTFLSTLTKALRLSYPAVERLVGAEFFEGAVRQFLEGPPPASGYLDSYGSDFPEFLHGFALAASLPYLADVARLEWAVNEALHGEDTSSIDLGALKVVPIEAQPRLRFIPDPTLRLLHVEYPVDALWRAVLAGDDAALTAIDLNSGAAWLIVHRHRQDLYVARLSEAEWRFLSQLVAGAKLGHTLASSSDIDAPALLASYLARGLFTDFHVSLNEGESA